jgi:hypothetical protein
MVHACTLNLHFVKKLNFYQICSPVSLVCGLLNSCSVALEEGDGDGHGDLVFGKLFSASDTVGFVALLTGSFTGL